ncbi:Calcipressin-like protein [Elsinoe australis]|uniref:Calcipressin-like protein n=1 Tax=Elsinoe australis TaxID=40998 RepID=A0A2P7ZQA4_9PEZI|nr:Calcipressin-like protein [Elsinoe australis]
MPQSRRSCLTDTSTTTTTSRRSSTQGRIRYRIPRNHHLLITTPGAIHAWDCYGIHKIFNSSRQGILAAKASKDGSQILAVADSQVVVLHDCRRNREESWGLNSSDGHVRLLEYAPDAKSLFLSTTLTGAVQCYSVHEARMSRPTQEHPSAPTVLAVNPTAQLMISASESPPVTYIQNIHLETPAHKLEPSASRTPVVVAAFHPDRSDIFLLGFKDGTLAAYDATRLARKNGARMDVNASLDMEGDAAEIAVFRRLHRTMNRSSADPDFNFSAGHFSANHSIIHDCSVGVTAAAFIPGHLTRAVSVGGDGRCRIVDFVKSGVVLQTWNMHAHATSLAVLQHRKLEGSKRVKKQSSEARPGSCIFAVGTEIGKIVLYDTLGGQIHAISVDSDTTVLGLEWVEGTTPGAIRDSDMMPRRLKHASVILTESGEETEVQSIREEPIPRNIDRYQKRDSRRESGVVAALTLPETQPYREEIGEDFGTVLRSPQLSNQAERIQLGSGTAKFADLFSPQRQSRRDGPTRFRPHSPTYSPARPRISSNTFTSHLDSDDDVSPKTATENSRSTLTSEPAELDPNLTLSYLNAPTNTSRTLGSGFRQDRTFMVTPGYMVTSSSDYSFSSDPPTLVTGQIRIPVAPPGNILVPPARPVSRQERRHAHPSPAKPKRRSQQRPSFTAYMNRTAATDLRRRSRRTQSITAFSRQRRTSGAAISIDSQVDDDGQWLTSGSETEKATSRLPTTLPPTRTMDMSAPSHLANVPWKDSAKRPAQTLISPQTIYYDAPTYPPTRNKGRLLESLRRNRPQTTIKAFPYTSFMPSDPSKMPRPQQHHLPPTSKSPEITITPPAPERRSSKPISTSGQATLRSPQCVKFDTPRQYNDDYFHSKREKDLPDLPGGFPMSTTSEEGFTAPETQPGFLNGRGEFTPTSAAIRAFCPRESSLAQTKSRSAQPARPSPRKPNSSVPMSKYNPSVQVGPASSPGFEKCIPGHYTSQSETETPASVPKEANWRALEMGMGLSNRRRQSVIGPNGRAKGKAVLREGPARRSRFTEGQIDGLVEAVVDAVQKASDVGEMGKRNRRGKREGDKGERRSTREMGNVEGTGAVSASSSGLTSSPLRVIRYYEEKEVSGDFDNLDWQKEKGKSNRFEQSENAGQERGVRTGVREEGAEKRHGRVLEGRLDGSGELSGGQTAIDDQGTQEPSCPCCETLVEEISMLRQEIVGLRADLTGDSMGTDEGRRRDGRRRQRRTRRSNDLYSFSETR